MGKAHLAPLSVAPSGGLGCAGSQELEPVNCPNSIVCNSPEDLENLDSIFLQGVVIIFGVVSFMAVGIHFIIILREISL